MAAQEDPKLPSFHGHNKSTATYGITILGKGPKGYMNSGSVTKDKEMH